MPTRLTLHLFESDPSLPQRDGVNLAHTEINCLLSNEADPDLQVHFHDFARLLRDPAYAIEVLADVDCVLCNVGPHAHYYHYLRDQLGLNFRIVRDIKTALWSGYLLQESLCDPYLRPGDTLLATSHYSRVLTQHIFPHLRSHSVHLFEPVLAYPAKHASAKRFRVADGEKITLGYVGRLSEDKNFPQIVELLMALDQAEPGKYQLVAVGAVHSASCEPSLIADKIYAKTGRNDLFRYLPPVAHDEVLTLLPQFDYFLFFSTSNLEVLGRVLLEAAHTGVPILAANHAAAPELLAPTSLIDVHYTLEQTFHSHFDVPLGRIDIAMAASKIRRGEIPNAPPEPQINRRETLMDILVQGPGEGKEYGLNSLPQAQRRFLERLRWEGLTRYSSRREAGSAIESMLDWFCALNGKSAHDFEFRLQELERRSRFQERTRRFMAAAARTRCDFTNLGGIDVELCNIVGYHPQFRLSDLPQAQVNAAELANRREM
jgi:glycosyltransferase involved in cell wall biosynthesis